MHTSAAKKPSYDMTGPIACEAIRDSVDEIAWRSGAPGRGPGRSIGKSTISLERPASGSNRSGTPRSEDCVRRRRQMGSVMPPGRIALEPERATVEGDFLSILALIAITINGLPPPSWPALCRPSTPSGSAIDSPVLIALYFQPLRAGYNGVIVDGRVKPGHDDLSRPRTTKQHLSLQEPRSFCRFFLTKSEICSMCSY
jgi:hypothetical protein